MRISLPNALVMWKCPKMDDNASSDGSSGAPEDVFRRHAEALRRRAQNAERKGLEALERGLLLSATEELREAVETYRSIADGARVSSAQQYLALALYENGETEAAVSIWEELVGQGWTRPTTLNFLVRHYESMGDSSEVERLYARLADAKEKNAEFFDDYRPLERAAEHPHTLQGTHTILIADNDEAVRQVLGRMMKFEGFSVLFAEDGDEALSIIFENAPDLILLDVYMPKQSGLDVLYRMRAEGMDTPVVVISGGAYATMVRDAKLLGARFVSKPLNFEELDATIRELLGITEEPVSQ